MNKLLLSVLMVVYNEPVGFLRKAIESILCQSVSEFEFVIINDGSEGSDTLDILTKYQYEDSRIKLVHKENEGFTKSLNYGIYLCKSNLVFRQDPDDWSHPQRFKKQLDFLLERPEHVLVGTNYAYCKENGTVLWRADPPTEHMEIVRIFPHRNPFCHGSVCFRKDIAELLGYYRDGLVLSQDYDFFWRISERYTCGNLTECLYFLRRTENSMSVKNTEMQMIYGICTQKLSAMRKNGSYEDFDLALTHAKSEVKKSGYQKEILFLKLDQLMISGYYRKTFFGYVKFLRSEKLNFVGFLKLLRFLVYLFLPGLRKFLFR
jgi:glycosyltransferase involved in cell wall biosynthesis